MSQAGSSRSGASSSKTHKGKRPQSAEELIGKLHETLGHDGPLSLTDHLSAGRKLCRLRDRLAHGERPPPKAFIALLCTGISVHRRWAVGESAGAGTGGDEMLSTQGNGPKDEAAERRALDGARELVRVTAVRIFSLLCMVELDKRMTQLERGLDALDIDGESRKAVTAAGMGSLWEVIKDPPPLVKRTRRVLGSLSESDAQPSGAGEEGEEEEEQDEDTERYEREDRPSAAEAEDEVAERRRSARAWERALRVSSGEVARHALRIGSCCLDDESWAALDGIMPLFFRNSAFNMAESLLMPDGDADFASLSVAKAMAEMGLEQREKKLLSIAQAGESEAGQQVVRDMMLSFLLPASHVGVRRTLLLTRAASTRAGVDHPVDVARAHDVAMAGTEWLWVNGTDKLERMCCLLAGVAVLTTKGGEDPIRKTDAFCGRVQLPFFETRPPERPEFLRIALVPNARRWILYKLSKRGLPEVLLSQRGFTGLCDAALHLVASLR